MENEQKMDELINTRHRTARFSSQTSGLWKERKGKKEERMNENYEDTLRILLGKDACIEGMYGPANILQWIEYIGTLRFDEIYARCPTAMKSKIAIFTGSSFFSLCRAVASLSLRFFSLCCVFTTCQALWASSPSPFVPISGRPWDVLRLIWTSQKVPTAEIYRMPSRR